VGLGHDADARLQRRQESGGDAGGSRALADLLPNAELLELDGVSHNVKMNVPAPVLADFFAAQANPQTERTPNDASPRPVGWPISCRAHLTTA
jgi:hypothetical protein